MQINFSKNGTESHHQCRGRQDGDWIVFTCPHCPGFERRMNLQSGEMKVRPGSDPEILHQGTWSPDWMAQFGSMPN